MFILNNGSVTKITEALQKTFMLKQQNSFLTEIQLLKHHP